MWIVINADGVVVGRLAAEIAKRLRGKHVPDYAPYRDGGDHVIVVNADKAVLTGRKSITKRYRHHSGFIGGIKERSVRQIGGAAVIEKAVQRMMPRNNLARKQLGKLHVYARPDHPHQAQQPREFDFASANRKNRNAG